MRPVLIAFTFESLFPLLIILALVFHAAALYINKRYGSQKKVPEKITMYINSLRSLGNTFFILAAVALVAFKALGMEKLPLHSYGLMLAIAFLSAIWLAEKRAPIENIAPRDIGILSIGIIIAALIGSRLFYHLFEVPPKNLLDIFAVWRGGLVVYGGIICAVATVWVMMVRRKMPVGATFDVFSAPLALGIFLGRLGCFFAGCCYGNATESVCGMVFPKDAQVYGHLHKIVMEKSEALSQIPESFVENITAQNYELVPVHPTQLYESLLALAGFGLILLFYKKKGFSGETFLWVLGYYAIIRFFLETMRIDTPRDLFLGSFSLSQAIGLIALPVIIGAIAYGRIRAHARAKTRQNA